MNFLKLPHMYEIHNYYTPKKLQNSIFYECFVVLFTERGENISDLALDYDHINLESNLQLYIANTGII